ncbi:AAA family ATPase [Candidatus Ferrigenium straubiae]|jgi:DNA repair exonuclease SbcCD ATPase subunit|uniref:AAA family ATPase n=1 Tax=Candidatus Ferrigenium straubiae TaxID=2919506 RepID=UPI003F4AB5E6
MILSEYRRFSQTLGATTAPDMRKVANLVLQHWGDLLPLTTAQGQRVKKFVELAQTYWDTISADIQLTQVQPVANTNAIRQLKSLRVGPFRGFAKPENFDLSSSLVLIYGPNGTGKSSFCESLEYGLLGSVADAESKRFREQNDYLKNAHTDTFSAPVIWATDSQGQESVVQANEAVYRFCFVEKNRIDNFSRIAAQTPAKQTELISTLFGLDSFNEFVRNFSPDIDGNKYIDLIGKKAEVLKQKRQSLAGSEQQRKANAEELKRLDSEEIALASQYREGITFAQMVMELRGDDENSGRIEFIESELQQPLAAKSQLTIANLQGLQQGIRSNLANASAKEQALKEAGQQVSFKQLYEAVSQVQASSPSHCPACKTSLQQVTVNPYTHASGELKKLQHLAQLQQELHQLNVEINQSLNSLAQVVAACIERLQPNNVLSAYHVSSVSVGWWNYLHQTLSDGFTPWQHLEAQVRQLEETDKAIDQAAQQRTIKQQQLTRLREFDTKITQLQTRRTTADTAITSADQAIANFEAVNAQLIVDATTEIGVVAKNKAIAHAYASFVAKLNDYKNKLPAQLVADLGDKVVELYNAFNRNDLPNEKLSSVRLPLSQNERLRISFQTEPTRWFDALHVLSEGHIRCIGLAILMAKNIKENCPILIFDDPVNAIDDEHRRTIRETLFVDDFFKGKQIILAIHGEEFFNSTHQLIGKEAAKIAESYIFASNHGQHHIQVHSLKRPKNYVLAARELYDTGEYRDSLMSARRGLENLCEKAWYHYGKHSDKSDSPISVSRRAPNQPWDLRSLADNLKSKFKSSKAEILNKEQIVNSLSKLLGTDANQPPWTYLNKGTHDETDLPEFDQIIVGEIVIALEQLDTTLS